MPSFKTKAIKKATPFNKNSVTLDNKHKEFVTEFSKDETNVIPKLKDERKYLKRQLSAMVVSSAVSIDQIMDVTDRIAEITKSIRDLKSKKTNYYLDNSKYIFEYFENRKNIDTNDPKKNLSSKSQIIYNMFKVKPSATEDTPSVVNDETNTNDLVKKYLCNVNDMFIDMNEYIRETDICQSCLKGEIIPLDDEGVLICNHCAVNVQYLVDHEKPSYKEPPKEVCFYAYKRINHFKEILAQFQGKETTQIPDSIIDLIKQQIKKERIGLHELSHTTTKELLKKLELNKYYEHIAFIKNKLGIKPPIFSNDFEDTLCNLFMEIQSPYSKVCPNDRVNFLHYYYVLYQFCVLLGETQYLTDIPMLKPEKLIEQDEIWKKICAEMEWEFNPAV